MGKVLMEMSMSLDGYVAGPDVSAEFPMGRGGERLHEWMFAGRSAAESERFETDHYSGIGALIIGRRMADLGIGPWGEEPPSSTGGDVDQWENSSVATGDAIAHVKDSKLALGRRSWSSAESKRFRSWSSRRWSMSSGSRSTRLRPVAAGLSSTVAYVAPPSIQEYLGYSRTRVAVGCAGSMP